MSVIAGNRGAFAARGLSGITIDRKDPTITRFYAVLNSGVTILLDEESKLPYSIAVVVCEVLASYCGTDDDYVVRVGEVVEEFLET